MPKKKGDKNIKYPLVQGLPSKIYLLAYGGKLHGYKLAEIIKFGWNTPSVKERKKQNPKNYRVYPSRVYEEIENRTDIFYKDEENKENNKRGQKIIPIKTHIKPLIQQMEVEIGEEFDDETRKTLYDFFDHKDFRSYIFEYAKKRDFREDVHAFFSIMNLTVPIARFSFMLKKTLERKNTPIKQYKKNQHKLLREIKRRGITPNVSLNIITAYLPEDIKNKMPDNATDINIVIKLANMLIDLKYEVLEIIMKMPTTYEIDRIVDATMMSMPEIIDMAK